MVMVWIRDGEPYRIRFHRSPDCRNLRKRPANGEPNELREVDLDELSVRPCLTCYPDAPRVKIVKQFCHQHQTKLACEHNGGVLVVDRGGHERYVWPDSNSMPYYRRSSIA